MASEIRVNKINNRAGLGTITIADTGVVVNGIVTCTEVSGLNVLNIAGVSTFASPLDINGDIDVDGHTNLDNVNISGMTTTTGNLFLDGGKINVGTGVTIESTIGASATGQATFTGIVTASSFRGDCSQLTGIVGGAMTAYNNSNHLNVTTFIAGYEAGEDIQKQNSDGNSAIGNILIGDRAGYKAQNA